MAPGRQMQSDRVAKAVQVQSRKHLEEHQDVVEVCLCGLWIQISLRRCAENINASVYNAGIAIPETYMINEIFD